MSFVNRAKALILRPTSEWQVIAAEPTDTSALFTGYAMPLAAIPTIAGFISTAMFVQMLPFEVPIGWLIASTILFYLLGLGALYVLGRIVRWMAPKFGGSGDGTAAMKLVVHAGTAYWLAGIFAMIPMLGILGILGFYSLYLFHVGAQAVLGIPRGKALGFTISVVVTAILLAVLVTSIGATLLPTPRN